MEKPQNSVSCHRYRPAAVLKITGEDAFLFLQGQFTQDLRPCIPGGFVVYGLWLNQKGKALADSFVMCRESGWLVISLLSPAATIRERLETYVIADDVTVEDVTAQWAGLAVFGPDAADFLATNAGVRPPAMPGAIAEARRGFVFQGRRMAGANWEWLYPVDGDDATAGLRTSLACEAGSEVMEQLRIEAGIPSVPRDIGPDDLPNEGGLEADAISYTKGCYLGQEVMARLKTLGRLRRRLVRVAGPVVPPRVLPAPLFAEGKRIGELRSVARTEAGFVGLAMVSLLGMTERRWLGLSVDGPANIAIAEDSP